MENQSRATLVLSARDVLRGIEVNIITPIPREDIAVTDMHSTFNTLKDAIDHFVHLSHKYYINTLRIIGRPNQERDIVKRVRTVVDNDYPGMAKDIEILRFDEISKYQ